MNFSRIFSFRNGKNFSFAILLISWVILFFSASVINNSSINSANAQTGYHFAPGLVLTGTNYQDTPSSASLQLSQFSVAAWFKTSTNFASESFIVNKGGIGSDSAGQNMNYQISMTSTEQIKAGFETSSGAD